MLNNNKNLHQITLSSIFLAIIGILILIQIPFYSFLTLDLSGIAILFSLYFLELKYSILVSIFSAFFLLIIGKDFLSIFIVILFNLSLIFFHKIIYNDSNLKFKILSSISIILLISSIFTFLNFIFFLPAWYGFDYSFIFENWLSFFLLIFIFNLSKLLLIYFIFNILLITFRKTNNLHKLKK